MPPVRRLTAILAADVAGYSRLMGAAEEETHARLQAHLRELVNPKIAEHRGRIVKNTGDGFLAEFASVVDAVRCAVEVQRAMADRNAGTPAEKRIEFRAGINLGDVIAERDDIFGDGVNVAARLEALAEPGGICVSRVVRAQVRDKLDFAFEDMGEQQVKNIARPVRVYRVRDRAVPIEQPLPASPQSLPLPDKPSIAVLPFTNMSSDPEQEFFADGIAEDVITALSRVRPNQKLMLFQQEVAAFPEYYAQYFKEAMLGGTIVPVVPVICVGPVKYRGEQALQQDIDNLKAAATAAGVPHDHVFMPATAPSGVGINEYYKTEEEYFHALAAELNKEYKGVVAAGFLIQVDDPFLPDIFFEPGLTDAQKRRRAEIYVEASNAALNGIPAERVRFHTCYGINEGPRLYEATLADIIEYVLKVNAGSFSFEAANPRHEHEYHLFERVKVPEGKVLCPGVITHASNIVEHPELIAERLMRFAKLVGRENVMAGADCGFSSQALYKTEVHPTVVWEKFKAMRQGADLATKQLWK